MPKIIKTVESAAEILNNPSETVTNMAKAIAEAAGGSAIEMSDSTEEYKKYYVPMASIGYSGWCVCMLSYDNNGKKSLKWGIYTMGDAGPNLEEANSITFVYTGNSTGVGWKNRLAGTPETCVIIKDVPNNTVLFEVHHGRTLNGTDLNLSTEGDDTELSGFFARDVNDEVLCGLGGGHTTQLRTVNKKIISSDTALNTAPPTSEFFENTLHLTKMVNYLSPGCPEMKSAYVSVIRPIEKISGRNYNSFLTVNNEQFGRVGLADTWNSKNGPFYRSYYPYEPFVKY